MAKPFAELTTDEASAVAKAAVRNCRTVYEVRRQLTAAGFNGDAAEVTHKSEPSFTAIVKIPGPRGEDIFATVSN
jgi:hypothetical protein